MGNDPSVRPLGWNREDTTYLLQRGGNSMLDEPHERLDGNEPGITSARSVAALRLEVSQKLDHQRRVQLLELELRRRDTQLAAREFEEKLERVRVRVAGMIAGTLLDGKALGRRLKTLGGSPRKRDGTRGWAGLRLRTAADAEEPDPAAEPETAVKAW